jgi:hypothetical protein
MTITVHTSNVSTTRPARLEMIDASGAHVELMLAIGNLPPIRHAFDFSEGTVVVPLGSLAKGTHRCTLFVTGLKHKLSLNRMYAVTVAINGSVAAAANGRIPSGRGNDTGFGDFTLTV